MPTFSIVTGTMTAALVVGGSTLVAGSVLAQATPAPSSNHWITDFGQYTAIGVAVGSALLTVVTGGMVAFGTNIWPKPQIESSGFKAKYEELLTLREKDKTDALKFREQIASKIGDLQQQILKQDNEKKALIEHYADLTSDYKTLVKHILVDRGKLHPDSPILSKGIIIRDGEIVPDGPKVLLVEDDPTAREATRQVLTLYKCRAITAATVTEGLAALNEKPDVILLDLMLPDADGIEILKKIRADNLPYRVIVVTGKSDELLGAVKALNPFAIVQKPYDFEKTLLPHILPEILEKRPS